jgi:FkbM family methyltransferase
MLITIKKIFRFFFPVDLVAKEKNYFEEILRCKPSFESFTEVEGIYIVIFSSKIKIGMRGHKHSDTLVYDQIFIKEEYKIVVEILKQLYSNNYHIIDAGCNVGYTSLYLANKLTNTTIVAIEPCKENVSILHINVELNKLQESILIKEMALSADSEKRFVNSRDSRDRLDWANVTIEDENGEVQSITVNEIRQDEKWDFIDFLKIDIEGYEKEIFSTGSNLSFLQHTKVIAIEVHEDVMQKSEMELILTNNNFLIFNSGEITIGLNKFFFR